MCTNFVPAGSPHIPYGREALDSALDNLHGFYRTSVLLWQCQDWKDWETMARIHDTENQWAQVCFPYKLLLVEHVVEVTDSCSCVLVSCPDRM